ncbi:MAG: hypothetical protein ACREUG_01335 [Steroidobacteraceae bacterium]
MAEGDSPAADRERLIAAMNRYLEALDARDARRLPIAPTLRCTENTRELPLGTGLWRTIRGRRPGGHWFADADRGQVEYWGAVDEMGAEAIHAVRLAIEGRLITEIETLVIRGQGTRGQSGSFFEPAVVAQPDPDFHRVLGPAERVPRERLIAIANHYFDAIELSDGRGLPVADACRRLVNGVVDSMLDPAQAPQGESHRALGVAEQMTAGHYAYIEALRARRFPIVDESRGIAVCHVLFDHPGDLQRADGQIPFRTPNSMLAYEAFKVRGGILEAVWAIGTALPYGIDCGWPI